MSLEMIQDLFESANLEPGIPMRHILTAGVLTVLISPFLVGCDGDFLNVSPSDQLAPDNFYRDASDAESAVNAAYDPLQPLYRNPWSHTTSGASDDVDIYNAVALPVNNFSFSANLSRFDQVWQSSYQGVFRANLVLQNVPDIDIDQALKDRILGEARFLRALYYWHLTTYFGDVPLVTEANPTDRSAGEVPKSPVEDIYDLMISDLQEAKNLLPTRSELSDEELGRATNGAAQALLGKVYLYNENYASAEQELEAVINSGEYELIPEFSNINMIDNDQESIFEVQYSSASGESSIRAYYNLPQGHGGFGNRLPEQDLVDEFEDYNGPDPNDNFDNRDPRLYYSVFREGDFYDSMEPEFKSSWTETGYAMKKGIFPVTRDWTNMPLNEDLIRLGDVYLMAAEAAILKDGATSSDKAKAINWINKVRDRVNMPTYPDSDSPYSVDQTSSQQQIFEAIVHERRVELALEFHRFNDLRRWELAAEELGEFGYQSPKHRYFPIPQEEVDANPELDQNPNY
jgi:hypothetical protein